MTTRVIAFRFISVFLQRQFSEIKKMFYSKSILDIAFLYTSYLMNNPLQASHRNYKYLIRVASIFALFLLDNRV